MFVHQFFSITIHKNFLCWYSRDKKKIDSLWNKQSYFKIIRLDKKSFVAFLICINNHICGSYSWYCIALWPWETDAIWQIKNTIDNMPYPDTNYCGEKPLASTILWFLCLNGCTATIELNEWFSSTMTVIKYLKVSWENHTYSFKSFRLNFPFRDYSSLKPIQFSACIIHSSNKLFFSVCKSLIMSQASNQVNYLNDYFLLNTCYLNAYKLMLNLKEDHIIHFDVRFWNQIQWKIIS